jgi:hypothetical protein
MNRVIIAIALLIPTPVNAALIAEGCVPTTGVLTIDITLSKAIAKGRLSHELGGGVTANTKMATVTTETKSSITTTQTLTESVVLKSEHFIQQVKILESGYKVIDNQKQYCVLIGL